MGECKACVVDEAVNGSNSFGTLCFPNMIYHTDTANQGMLCVHGHQHDIASFFNSTGAGVYLQTSNTKGLGDGSKMPPGHRGTKHFATQSGDKSKETLLALCNADGSGLRIQSGGGKKPVIHLAIADGTSSITMTKGYIAIQCEGTETIWHGDEGKITVTYQLIQEHIKGHGKTMVV